MFEIEAIKAVKRDLRKIDPEVVEEIETIHFKNIRENPFQSHELGYTFKGLRSYHSHIPYRLEPYTFSPCPLRNAHISYPTSHIRH
jgi:hypothetical protein